TATIVNTCLSNYELIYQPDAGFIGIDAIVLRACETYTTEQYCVNIVRFIHVTDCVDTPLVAGDDDYYRPFLSTAIITPLDYDYADNLPVTITIVSQPSLGNAIANPDNTITYHAYNADTAITDYFTYQICDALGNCSNIATITLSNIPSIWYPIDTVYEVVTTPANESVELSFWSFIHSCVVYEYLDTINSLLHYGSIVVTSDGKYIYTPFENLVAPQQSEGLQEIIPYGIHPEYYYWNIPVFMVNITFPACYNDASIVPYQTPTFISVLDNDLGADPFGITSIDTPPQHGTAIVDNNHILYEPDSAYIGNDTLQYIACDYYGNCDTATVFIAVVPDSVIGISSILSNTFLSTKLWVYPNPTREVLNIVVAPDQQIQGIRVTDMAGHKLFSPTLPTTAGHRARVSIQHLPKGMYLVEVQTDVGVGVQKVLVE
ncbi:MAG TPA: Ig-like domain-containing protein, partial [Chitinophagales bacterium]|nr:Ig-like domain-containing protein [Chitinophagales bacterium]